MMPDEARGATRRIGRVPERASARSSGSGARRAWTPSPRFWLVWVAASAVALSLAATPLLLWVGAALGLAQAAALATAPVRRPAWFVATAAGSVGAGVAAIAVGVVLAPNGLGNRGALLSEDATVAVVGAVGLGVIGFAQAHVIRRVGPRVVLWPVVTGAGGAVLAVAAWRVLDAAPEGLQGLDASRTALVCTAAAAYGMPTAAAFAWLMRSPTWDHVAAPAGLATQFEPHPKE